MLEAMQKTAEFAKVFFLPFSANVLFLSVFLYCTNLAVQNVFFPEESYNQCHCSAA